MAFTQQDKEELYQYIISRGQGIASLPDGDSNLSNKYLAPVIEYTSGGTAGRLVRLAVSLLQGKGAVMRRNGDDVQWRLQGSNDAWENIFTVSSLKGDKGDAGKSPVFRKGETALEYKLEGEEDTAYKTLIALSDIVGPEGDHIVLRSSNGRIEYKQSKEADTEYRELLPLEDITGPKGDPGKDFQILGYYDTLADLKTAVSSPAAGDAYGVGTAAPYPIYIWDNVGGEWIDNGAIQGPTGPAGKSARINPATGYWQEYNDEVKQWQDTTYIVQYASATAEKDGLMPKGDKAKVDKIVLDGNGTKALLDNGTYGTVGGAYRLPEAIIEFDENSTSDEIFAAWGGSEKLLDFAKNYDTSKTYIISTASPQFGVTYNIMVGINYTDDANYSVVFAIGAVPEALNKYINVIDGVASASSESINCITSEGEDNLILGANNEGYWIAKSSEDTNRSFLALSRGKSATIDTSGDGGRFLANDGTYKAIVATGGGGNIYKLDIDISGNVSKLSYEDQTAYFGKEYTAPTSNNIVSLLGGVEGVRQLCEKLKPVNNPVVTVPYLVYVYPTYLVSTSVSCMISNSMTNPTLLYSPEDGCAISIILQFYSNVTEPFVGMASIAIGNFNTADQTVAYNYVEDKLIDIVNSLDSTNPGAALSASQGKILKGYIDKKVGSEEVSTIKKLSQSAYDALAAKDSKTLYACQQIDGTIVIR